MTEPTVEPRALSLARQATNGWACYAKRNEEHAEIWRLHQAIDNEAARLAEASPPLQFRELTDANWQDARTLAAFATMVDKGVVPPTQMLREVVRIGRLQEAACPSPSVCPYCELPPVLPEVCTPEIHAAIEKNIARDWTLFDAGYAHHTATAEARSAPVDHGPYWPSYDDLDAANGEIARLRSLVEDAQRTAALAEKLRTLLTNEVVRAAGSLSRQTNVCREQDGKAVFVTGIEAAREYLVETFADLIAERQEPQETPQPCYLIEWPAAVTSWFTGTKFSESAFNAHRYPTRIVAEIALREDVAYAIGRQCIVTEHLFGMTTSREPQPTEPTQSGMEIDLLFRENVSDPWDFKR